MIKKILVLLLSVFFLFGCGVEESFKDDASLTKITGILEDQSAGDAFKGTHVLVSGTEKVPVRSLQFKLGDSEYLGNSVELLGVYNPDDGVFEVTGVSVVEVLSPTDAEAVGGKKTFRDTDLGIELLYYADWQVDTLDGVLTFTSSSDNFSKVEVSQFPFSYSPAVSPDTGEEDTPLEAFLSEYYSTVEPSSDIFKKVGPDSLDAVYFQSDNGIENYFVYRSGLIYQITFVPSKDDDAKLIFKEMLGSFKFLAFTIDDSETVEPVSDSDDAYDAKSMELPDIKFGTFESVSYSFKGEYPASWYYTGSNGSGDSLRHYSFSGEPDGDELVSLDVISGSLPKGQSLGIAGLEAYRVEISDDVTIYAKIDGQNYSVAGDKSYEAIMIHMVQSLQPISDVE